MAEEKKDSLKFDLPEDEIENSQESERHHHHNHYHSHHRHHRKKKKKIAKDFFKKYGKALKTIAVIVCIFLFAFLVILADRIVFRNEPNFKNTEDTSQSSVYSYKKDLIYVGGPVIQGEVDLLSSAARDYIESDPSVPISYINAEHSDDDERRDLPRTLDLDFDVYHLPQGVTVYESHFELGDDGNFEKFSEYDLDSDYKITLKNLKSGTEYHYRAVFILSNGQTVTSGGTFKTMTGPRIMNIDGIYNVRDIGGWKTTDKKVIKQGLLFRGTEVDGAVEEDYKLTENGLTQMVLELGIKYDMDLRQPTDSVPGTYAMGPNVTHKYYGSGMYSNVFTDDGASTIKEIFKDLAKPENYPMYLHCTYGCDRTGTVCYILGALLGMSESDLIRDYELSGLHSGGIIRKNIQVVREDLKSYNGETLREQTENYLLSIGVTPEEIASIRNIFLESAQ